MTDKRTPCIELLAIILAEDTDGSEAIREDPEVREGCRRQALGLVAALESYGISLEVSAISLTKKVLPRIRSTYSS